MANFSVWDVVKVPFPYTDRPVRQRRPALIVAADTLEKEHGLIWVLMITSAENRGWPEDVRLTDLEEAGLPAPSLIRCAKIATIEARDAEKIGTLGGNDRRDVAARVARIARDVLV